MRGGQEESGQCPGKRKALGSPGHSQVGIVHAHVVTPLAHTGSRQGLKHLTADNSRRISLCSSLLISSQENDASLVYFSYRVAERIKCKRMLKNTKFYKMMPYWY